MADLSQEWTIREMLALACAVQESGDNNWASVPRTVRSFSDDAAKNEDFFSQKACAEKYAELLDIIALKRKRIPSTFLSESTLSSSTGVGAAAAVSGAAAAATAGGCETAPEQLVRRLSQERIQQLQTQLTDLYQELDSLDQQLSDIRHGRCDDQLEAMFAEIGGGTGVLHTDPVSMETDEGSPAPATVDAERGRTAAAVAEEADGSAALSQPLSSEKSDSQTLAPTTSEAPSVAEAPPSAVGGAAVSRPAAVSSPAHSEGSLSDDKLYRAWKRAILSAWRCAANHRHANIFMQPVSDDIAPGYSLTVRRPTNLTALRRAIESGAVRTTAAFQRDLIMVFANAIMYNHHQHDVHLMACEMFDDVMRAIEQLLSAQDIIRQYGGPWLPVGPPLAPGAEGHEKRTRRTGGGVPETTTPGTPSLEGRSTRRSRAGYSSGSDTPSRRSRRD